MSTCRGKEGGLGREYNLVRLISIVSSSGTFVNREQTSKEHIRPSIWFRYVDDTFVLFDNVASANRFLQYLNTRHPNIIVLILITTIIILIWILIMMMMMIMIMMIMIMIIITNLLDDTVGLKQGIDLRVRSFNRVSIFWSCHK